MHYALWRRHGDVNTERPHGYFGARPQTEPGAGEQCPFCLNWYANRRKLTQHCNRLHQAEMPVGCPACDQRFLNDRGKQTHMGHAHPDLIQYRRNDPAVQREWNLRTTYGIGQADYERMLLEQDGHCATCAVTEDESHRGRLHVDHDHATGEVRGLLCANCNRAIGLAADSPSRLRRMADYLEGGGR